MTEATRIGAHTSLCRRGSEVTPAPTEGYVAVMYDGEVHEASWRVNGSRLVLTLNGAVSMQSVGVLWEHPETMARLMLLKRLRNVV